MPTIAGIYVETMDGELLPDVLITVPFTQHGVGNQVITLEPVRPVPARIVSTWSGASDADVQIAGYLSLRGLDVTVVDQYGISTLVLVMQVEPARPLLTPDGVIVVCAWTMLPLGTP